MNERRYGDWAGNPRGNAEDPARCIEEVWEPRGGMRAYQCTRKRGKGLDGLYCGIHAKRHPALPAALGDEEEGGEP
jgi:hypothetical protein